MKLKKQFILPIVAATSLAAAIAPIAIVSNRQNSANTPSNNLKANESLFEVKNGVLKGFKSTVTQAQINEYAKDGVLRLPACRKIGSMAFKGLEVPFGTTIEIPTTTIEIGDYAFYRCSADKVTFTGTGVRQLKTIGKLAFANCTNLTTFPFPKSMLAGDGSIGDSAFTNCSQLRILDFIEDPAYDGKFTVADRNGLNNLSIGGGAFVGVLPTPRPDAQYLTVNIGELDTELPQYDDYSLIYMLSPFASKIQMKTSIGCTTGAWIKGLSVTSTEQYDFNIASIMPTDWMEISDAQHHLTGVKEQYKPLMSMIPFNAISVPSTVEDIDATFWEDLPDDIRKGITDLDLSSSGITKIPESFLYEDGVGPYIQPENICLSLATTVIGNRAFFAGGAEEEIRSNLTWVNLNNLNNLATIGEDAFNGNEKLSCFGKAPVAEAQINSEKLILDFGRSNAALNIGDFAFTDTGIKNIEFKFTGSQEASARPNITFGEQVFSELDLLSIVFNEDFRYRADYASNTITFEGTEPNSEPVSQAIAELIGTDNDHRLHTFQNSLDISDDTTHRSITIPKWKAPESNESPESIYSSENYFKINKTQVAPNMTGGFLKKSDKVTPWDLQDAMLATSEELANFTTWEIITEPSTEYEFVWEPGQTPTAITSVVPKMEHPAAGEPFKFVINFNTTALTIDRANTIITVNGLPFTNYELETNRPGEQATITIPASAVTGNIDATLFTIERTDIDENSIEHDDNVTTMTPLSSDFYQGEDIAYTLELKDNWEVDTDTTTVKIGESTIPYGPNGYEISQNSNGRFILTIHGWATANKGTKLDINILTKEVTYVTTALQYDNKAFKERPEEPKNLKVGDVISLTLDTNILNDGYNYVSENSYVLCNNSTKQNVGILYFTATGNEMHTTGTIPATTSEVTIVWGTSNPKLTCVLVNTPTEAWKGKPISPAFIVTGESLKLPIQTELLNTGYHYDLQNSKVQISLQSGGSTNLSFEESTLEPGLLTTKEVFPSGAKDVTISLIATNKEDITIQTDYNEDDFTSPPSFPTEVEVGQNVMLNTDGWELQSTKAVDVGNTFVECYHDESPIKNLTFEGLKGQLETTEPIPETTNKIKIVVATITIEDIADGNVSVEKIDPSAFKADPVAPTGLKTGSYISYKINPDELLSSGYLFDVDNCIAVCSDKDDVELKTLSFTSEGQDENMMITTSTIPAATNKVKIKLATKKALELTYEYEESWTRTGELPGLPESVSVGETVEIDPVDPQSWQDPYNYDLETTQLECTVEGETDPTIIGFDLVVMPNVTTPKFVAKAVIPNKTTKVNLKVGATNENVNTNLTINIADTWKEYIQFQGETKQDVKKYTNMNGTFQVNESYKANYVIDLTTSTISLDGQEKNIMTWMNTYSGLILKEETGKELGVWSFYVPIEMILDANTIIVTINLKTRT